MRKRWDAASRFVVFHDILVPLANGVTTARAFALILEQCGYEPLWNEDELGVTLHLKVRASGEIAPERFSRSRADGNAAVLRERIMSSVCAKGLHGWRTLPRDQYAIEHGIAVQTIHTVWDSPGRRRHG